MQTNQAVEQNKSVKWSDAPRNQPGRWGKVYGGKDMPKGRGLSSEWKTERVREDESGDREDGEDELPCVIGDENADYLTRLAKFSGDFIPYSTDEVQRTENSDAISDFQRGSGWWTSKSDHRWRTCVVARYTVEQKSSDAWRVPTTS